MKKILIRGGISPLECLQPEELYRWNAYGSNVGNSLYLYGVYRELMTEDTEIISTRYRTRLSRKEIEEINSEYSAFVIPLANAFREGFLWELRGLTNLVKKLTIPCIVIGVGTSASLDEDPAALLGYDAEIKEFINAVLEKSGVIGLRGSATAKYLKTLGYEEGKHFMVIGCPSMFTFGTGLQVREKELSSKMNVCANYNYRNEEEMQRFILSNMKKFDNYSMIWQERAELKMLYSGEPFEYNDNLDWPIRDIYDSEYRNAKILSPLSVPVWLDYLREIDFNFGSRIYGCVAGILAGTQTLLIAKDYRTLELAEVHNIPYINGRELRSDSDIFKVAENIDFSSHIKTQKENLDNYKKFLDINGLDHIFKDCDNPQNTKLDRLVKEISYYPMIKPIASLNKEEAIERFRSFTLVYEDEVRKYKDKNKELKEELKVARKKLNKKSVRTALKISDSIGRLKK